MFIIDILIYVLFAKAMYSFADKSERLYGDDTKIDKYLWGYILFFTVVSAVRWRVGIDSITYMDIFKEGKVREDSTEYIWDAIVMFVNRSGLHFAFGSGIAAFMQIYFLSRGMKEYKYILVWLPVVMFGGRYYIDLMNAVRQMIVACGFVYLSRYIVDRKLLRFTVGILLLSGIHHTALTLLPAYLCAYIPFGKLQLYNRRFLCVAILIVCVMIGQTPSFQGMVSYLEPMLSTFGYEKYSSWATSLLSGENTNEVLSFGPMMISQLLCGLAIIWYGPLLHEEYAAKVKCFSLWYLFALLFSCSYFLVCNVSHLFIRMTQPYELFLMIALAMLCRTFYIRKAQGYDTQFYSLIFIIWVYISIDLYKHVGNYWDFVSYKVFFNHL